MKYWLYYLKSKLRGEIPTRVLLKRGMKVGKNFNRIGQVMIDYGFCWLLEIGDDVTIGPRVIILTHDATTKMYTGKTKIGKVTIGDRVFVGANSTILPNVTIGNDVIIGANSVISRNIPDGVMVAGVPAKVICTTQEYIERTKSKIPVERIFDKTFLGISGETSEENKKKIKELLKDGLGFAE